MSSNWVANCMRRVAKDKILRADTLTAADQAALTSLGAKGNHAKTHAFIVSATELRSAAALLNAAFPATNHTNVVHAFAAKANPLRGVLEVIKNAGLGCETASFGEVLMSQKVFGLDKIVYDSPVKSLEELMYCCYTVDANGNGMYLINVDNFPELERIAALHKEKPIKATVGIRINPQLGAGTIGQCSTALATSKFGIGLNDQRAKIIAAFTEHKEFLKAVHVHTGSQGIGLTMMVAGVKAIVDLADEVNAGIAAAGTEGAGITIVDIGGGLPVNFASDAFTPTFDDYASRLKAEVPSLFAGKYALVTEFGRSIVAKAGILVSRVEYVKENGGRRIIQQHVGADLAIRTVWQPENWRLRVAVHDGTTGEEKTENVAPTDVAGPCCLGGDLLCAERDLPQAQELVDLVVAKDVGGYFHSAYSYYNLRAMPPCYLFDEEADTLTLINAGQSVAETVAMFD